MKESFQGPKFIIKFPKIFFITFCQTFTLIDSKSNALICQNSTISETQITNKFRHGMAIMFDSEERP
jgi:hypothetical protein